MNKIDFSIGQAAGVAIAPVNADATFAKANATQSVFAGLVVALRGAPGKVLSVSAANYQQVLGVPIHPRMGAAFESYRHVERAVKGGNGFVVRVCPSDMKVPAIALSVAAVEKLSGKTRVDGVKVKPDNVSLEIGESVQAVGGDFTVNMTSVSLGPYETPELGEGQSVLIYAKDGDASGNRRISLSRQDDGLFTLTLIQVGADGMEEVLESHQVAFEDEILTDMNRPAWLPVVLERDSSRIGAVVSENLPQMREWQGFETVAFEGGTAGTLSELKTADYLKALTILEGSPVNFTALLSLGCYDEETLVALNTLAADLRIDMFFDMAGKQKATHAIQYAKLQGLNTTHQACRYYFPYSCRDTFSGLNVVYGISCDAFVAKARGVAMVPDVGGWHYSPAGTSRGMIDRRNITPIQGMDIIDREAFVEARINTVNVSSKGEIYIDDALTTFGKNNYLRFQHVSSLMNAISRNFYDIAQALKHEPDGVTREGLMKGMTALLERFYASGALVIPRDPSEGTEPFVIDVVQQDFDLWEVTWSVCPTGTSRRIVGKPVLMR